MNVNEWNRLQLKWNYEKLETYEIFIGFRRFHLICSFSLKVVDYKIWVGTAFQNNFLCITVFVMGTYHTRKDLMSIKDMQYDRHHCAT